MIENEKITNIEPQKFENIQFLLNNIPDIESIIKQEQNFAQFIIKPSFSFIKSKLTVNLEIKKENNTVFYFINSKGMSVSNKIKITINFEPEKIKYKLEIVELTGLLKLVPTGLIKGTAQKIIDDFWLKLEK